jgi:hypothetical protein
MSDQPDVGPESSSADQPSSGRTRADIAPRRLGSLKGPALGAILGGILVGGLNYGVAFVFLGLMNNCWG